jgi:hypothetical protein
MSDKQWAEQWIKKVVDNFHNSLIDMEVGECKEVLKIVKGWSPTNCWYGKYWMKDAIIKSIESRLRDLGHRLPMEEVINNSIDEEWKPIAGLEAFYEVSDTGRVKRLKRLVWNNLSRKYIPLKECILPGCKDDDGYLRINLRMRPGVWARVRIHRLIAEAFIENPGKKPVVNHKDGNKTNNHKDNLQWTTILENIRHAHGKEDLIGATEYNPKWQKKNKKIKEGDRLRIKEMINAGLTTKQVAAIFKISHPYVSAIYHNRA